MKNHNFKKKKKDLKTHSTKCETNRNQRSVRLNWNPANSSTNSPKIATQLTNKTEKNIEKEKAQHNNKNT